MHCFFTNPTKVFLHKETLFFYCMYLIVMIPFFYRNNKSNVISFGKRERFLNLYKYV